ncbi:hypothetical protein PSHT_06384 [Puccinia striiformis]|uniref:Uncharacterized protein n=1 Tax=Puccinia striiformis TaxID=27350 RepID=A0A2S4W6P7_9BASI|nr:hypothetical protein PSHT_06384 [Puccinia striiformis]
MESYEEWEEASSLVEASKAKAFSAQDEQDFTVVKSLLNQSSHLKVVTLSNKLCKPKSPGKVQYPFD